MIVEVRVESIERGHRASLYGQSAVFQSDDGPNDWTKAMAVRGVVLACWLQREERALASDTEKEKE